MPASLPRQARACPRSATRSPSSLMRGRTPSRRYTLDLLGDCLVVSGSDAQWHVHIHVADAGAAIEAGLSAGPLSKITITYLNGTQGHPPAGSLAHASRVVAIAEGPGLGRLLRQAGATVVESPDPA